MNLQDKWAQQKNYATLVGQCIDELDKVVLMLRFECAAEARRQQDAGYLMLETRQYAHVSEEFAKLRDDFVHGEEDGQDTTDKIRFIHAFVSKVVSAQKRFGLDALDTWCGWRDTSRQLGKAREVAGMVDEFGEAMAVKWFEGVFK